MKRSIGLGAPLAALIGFALLFNPWSLPLIPKRGTWGVLLSPQTYFLLAALTVMKIRSLRASDVGLSSNHFFRQLLRGLWIGLLPAALTATIGLLLLAVESYHPFLPRPLLGGSPIPGAMSGLNLFVLLVFAPITEELFFRGILLRALREKHPVATSIALSALIFMGGHGGFALGPLLLGFITGWMTLRFGSIVPGVLFHAICNGYGPILIRFFPNLYRYLDIFFRLPL